MKSYRTRALTKLIALLTCAALASCGTDSGSDSSTDTTSGTDTAQSQEDTTSEDANAPDDAISQDTEGLDSESQDTQDATPNTPDSTDEPDSNNNPDTSDEPDTTDTPDSTDVDADDADSQPDASHPPAGSTCEEAIDITAGGTWADRTTAGVSNDYDARGSVEDCPVATNSGPDEVFLLAPANDTTYDLTVTPTDSSFLPILYIREDCSTEACVDGSKFRASDNSVTLPDITVPGGARYKLIVDTDVLSFGGPYTLDVEIQ